MSVPDDFCSVGWADAFFITSQRTAKHGMMQSVNRGIGAPRRAVCSCERLDILGLTANDFASLLRGDERKAALAAVLRSRTTGSEPWTPKSLSMGRPSRVMHPVKATKNQPLRKKFEAALKKIAALPGDFPCAASRNSKY